MSSAGDFLSKFGGGETEDVSSTPSMLNASAPNALGAFMDVFSTMSESYFFYKGEIELRFDATAHQYFRVEELGNLVPVHGCTTVLHILDKSFALVPWAVKKAAEKLLRTIPLTSEMMLAPLSLEDFTKLVMEAKEAHREILTDAGDIGHLAHKCLEDSIQYAIDHTDGVVLELRNLPTDEKALSCAQAAFAWMTQHHVKWLGTERKIYSKQYEYAGTADGFAWVNSCEDKGCCPEKYTDHLALIDWKSSNDLHVEYCYQTAAYLQAILEEFKK
jgi:hypothetical protein